MNDIDKFNIKNAKQGSLKTIGQLMVQVYSQLEGFPSPGDQPKYYEMLANVGLLTETLGTEILVAYGEKDEVMGAVVYFDDMKNYGSGGIATQIKNAAGFRLLAVNSDFRGLGIGKALSIACIDKAKQQGRQQLIIHTTNAMKVAWGMYEKLGFVRSEELDFLQKGFPVFGFKLDFSP